MSWGFAEQEQDSGVAVNKRREEEKWKGGPVGEAQDKGWEGKKELLETKREKRKTMGERVAVPLHWVSTTHTNTAVFRTSTPKGGWRRR